MGWRPVPSVSAGDALPRTDDEQTIRLLGPYRVNHDTPDVTDVCKVADLDSGVIVIRTWVETVTEWDSVDPAMAVGVGGTDWAPDDYDYTQTSSHRLTQVQSGVGWTGESGAQVDAIEPRIVRLSTAGALVVGVTLGGGSATQGAADIYALILDAT